MLEPGASPVNFQFPSSFFIVKMEGKVPMFLTNPALVRFLCGAHLTSAPSCSRYPFFGNLLQIEGNL